MSERFREQAREFAMVGVAGFARALNLTHDAERPWRTSPEVHERAVQLLTELVGLVAHEAEFEPNPAHRQLKAARSDAALQGVLSAAARKAAG